MSELRSLGLPRFTSFDVGSIGMFTKLTSLSTFDDNPGEMSELADAHRSLESLKILAFSDFPIDLADPLIRIPSLKRLELEHER
jgi:hypothetical protein